MGLFYNDLVVFTIIVMTDMEYIDDIVR